MALVRGVLRLAGVFPAITAVNSYLLLCRCRLLKMARRRRRGRERESLCAVCMQPVCLRLVQDRRSVSNPPSSSSLSLSPYARRPSYFIFLLFGPNYPSPPPRLSLSRTPAHPVGVLLGGALHDDKPQAPDVGAVAVSVVFHPLRGHVLKRSHEGPAHGEAALKASRDPEIRDLA